MHFTEEQLIQLGCHKKPSEIRFDEDTIRAIFGHEAAENESIERLKSYYYFCGQMQESKGWRKKLETAEG